MIGNRPAVAINEEVALIIERNVADQVEIIIGLGLARLRVLVSEGWLSL
jgi:hypothetical protein